MVLKIPSPLKCTLHLPFGILNEPGVCFVALLLQDIGRMAQEPNHLVKIYVFFII